MAGFKKWGKIFFTSKLEAEQVRKPNELVIAEKINVMGKIRQVWCLVPTDYLVF